MALVRCPQCGRVGDGICCFACGYEWPSEDTNTSTNTPNSTTDNAAGLHERVSLDAATSSNTTNTPEFSLDAEIDAVDANLAAPQLDPNSATAGQGKWFGAALAALGAPSPAPSAAPSIVSGAPIMDAPSSLSSLSVAASASAGFSSLPTLTADTHHNAPLGDAGNQNAVVESARAMELAEEDFDVPDLAAPNSTPTAQDPLDADMQLPPSFNLDDWDLFSDTVAQSQEEVLGAATLPSSASPSYEAAHATPSSGDISVDLSDDASSSLGFDGASSIDQGSINTGETAGNHAGLDVSTAPIWGTPFVSTQVVPSSVDAAAPPAADIADEFSTDFAADFMDDAALAEALSSVNPQHNAEHAAVLGDLSDVTGAHAVPTSDLSALEREIEAVDASLSGLSAYSAVVPALDEPVSPAVDIAVGELPDDLFSSAAEEQAADAAVLAAMQTQTPQWAPPPVLDEDVMDAAILAEAGSIPDGAPLAVPSSSIEGLPLTAPPASLDDEWPVDDGMNLAASQEGAPIPSVDHDSTHLPTSMMWATPAAPMPSSPPAAAPIPTPSSPPVGLAAPTHMPTQLFAAAPVMSLEEDNFKVLPTRFVAAAVPTLTPPPRQAVDENTLATVAPAPTVASAPAFAAAPPPMLTPPPMQAVKSAPTSPSLASLGNPFGAPLAAAPPPMLTPPPMQAVKSVPPPTPSLPSIDAMNFNGAGLAPSARRDIFGFGIAPTAADVAVRAQGIALGAAARGTDRNFLVDFGFNPSALAPASVMPHGDMSGVGIPPLPSEAPLDPWDGVERWETPAADLSTSGSLSTRLGMLAEEFENNNDLGKAALLYEAQAALRERGL